MEATDANFLFAFARLRDVVGCLHPHERVHLHSKSLLDAEGHLSRKAGREFDFPQRLKPLGCDARSGTAEEVAERFEKQIPRGLKPARDDENRTLIGTTEVVP